MTANLIQEQISKFEVTKLGDLTIRVPLCDEIPDIEIVEQKEIINKALATWLNIDGVAPLNFRLYGPAGVGKNTIVYHLARILQKELYIIRGGEELRPEEITCSPIATSSHTFEYIASPLFAAMLRGGICFFDELSRAPHSVLAPLASVLDDRRTLTSVNPGICLKAHPEFLFCAAL